MYEILSSTTLVKKIVKRMRRIDIVLMKNGGEAINYRLITGRVKKNDQVVVNKTARLLDLGTGGYDFIICNLNNINKNNSDKKTPGHMMKSRYTPQQVKTMCVEEEESPYRNKIINFTDLEGKI